MSNRSRVNCSLEVALLMIALQTIKNISEHFILSFLPETRFADKMMTMTLMAVLAAAAVLYAKLRRQPLSVFPSRFSGRYAAATLVAAGLMIATPSNYTGGYREILVLVYGSIVTPIYEELVFRGFIWNRLEGAFKGKYTAYIVSSVLFGIWHLGYMLPQLLAGNRFAVLSKVAVGLAYGFILGFVRLKTKNCYSTMLLHGVMNLFAF